jgi:hypothetical protein
MADPKAPAPANEEAEFSALEQELYKTAATPPSEEQEFEALAAQFSPEEVAEFSQLETEPTAEQPKGKLTQEQLAEMERKYADSPSGIVTTFAQHMGKGATGGFLDEIAGFTRAAVLQDSAKATPDEDISYLDRASRTQEAYDFLLDKSAEDNPLSAFAGDLVGSFLGPGRFVKGVRSAAAFGAVEGLGRSKADVLGSNRDLAKVVTDSLVSGALGAGTFWGMDKFTKSKLWQQLDEKASRKFKQFADQVDAKYRTKVTQEAGVSPEQIAPASDKDTLRLLTKTQERLNAEADKIMRIMGVMDEVGIAKKEQFVEKLKLFAKTDRKSFNNFREATMSMPASQTRQLAMDALENPAVAPRKEYIVKAAQEAYNSGDARLLKALRKIEAKKGELSATDLVKLEMREKGIKASPDMVTKYLAYKQFEDEMAKYVTFAAGRSIKAVDPTKPAATLVGKAGRSLRQDFSEAIAQGRINGDTYQAFKAHEKMMEVAAEYTDEVMQRTRTIPPVSQSDAFRYVGDLRYVAAKIDARTGLDLGPLVDDIYVSQNNHTAFVAKHMKEALKIIDARRKAGVGSRDLYAARADKQATPLTQMLDDLFENVRTEANSLGLNIAKKENYIRHAMKPMHEVIPEIQKWHDELKPDVFDTYFAGLKSVGDDKKAWKKLFKDDEIGREYVQLHNAVEQVTGETIQSYRDFVKIVNQLKGANKSKESPLYKAGMALRRRGLVPERLRENDADRLMINYINDISKAIHYTGNLQQVQSKAAALRELGMGKEADYLDRYVLNMSGIPTGLTETSTKARQAFRTWVQEVAEERPTLKNLEALPEVMDLMAQSIYPNMLGMNAKATLRNYTQPFFMTSTDINQDVMSTYGFKLAGKAAAQAFQRLGQLGKDLTARGLAPADFVGEGSEALAAELRDGVVGKAARGTKTFNEWVMKMYAGSDVLNRHITMNMADMLTADLRAAVRNPGKLTRNQQAAKAFVANMEPGYRNRIQELIRKDGAISQDVQNEIAKYLVAKTQLVYGKGAQSQLQRDVGSLGSMFTKWPTAVGSEISYELTDNGMKGLSKIFRKYLAPWGALYGAYQLAGNKKPSPRDKVFVDPSPHYYTPLNSLNMVIEGDLVPPPLTAIAGLSKAAMSDKREQELPKATKQATKLLVPVVGFWVNAYDNYYTKLYKNEKPK